MHNLSTGRRLLQLLDSITLLSRKERHVQARQTERKLGVRGPEWRHDCLLHAEPTRRLSTKIKSQSISTRLVASHQTLKVLSLTPSKGFRMLIGAPTASTRAEADRYPQLTYTCLQDMGTRFPETKEFPKKPCPAGIMVNLRFPT